MPMQRVKRKEAITKRQFHSLLRSWHRKSNDEQIGDVTVAGVTPWVYVEDNGSRYRLHSDTGRQAVADYLTLVDRFGDAIVWSVVPNTRGRRNAVAYGPSKERIVSFYFCLAT